MTTKKITRFAMASFVCMLGLLPVQAKTTTWKGDAGTAASPCVFSEAANWDNGVPEPGDIVVLKTSMLYLTNAVPFDIGSAGLTISASNQTYFKFGFTGSGSLEFTGNVRHVIQAVSTHTGGTIVRNGYLDFNAGNPNPMGTGPITLYQASATKPYLSVSGSEKTFANKLVLRGDPSLETWRAFDSVMGKSFDSIESDHDFTIRCTERGLVVDNGISAPGKTVTFLVSNSKPLSALKHETDIYGDIDANVVVEAYGSNPSNKSIVRFFGESTVASNTLTVASGTNILADAAVWAGTNITVGATATLQLSAAGNLSDKAHIAVEEGGRIMFESAFMAKVAALSVGDTVLPVGIYGASDLPGTIEGSGRLFVAGGDGGIFTWTDGNGTHVWSEPGNWDKNEVPGTGAAVYFPSAVSEENAVMNNDVSVDVGSAGMTLFVGETVEAQLAFTGSGALNITGSGRLNLRKACTHTGGTRLSGSTILVPYPTASPLGAEGTITIDGSGGGNPYLLIPNYNTTIPNDIAILGVITNRGYSANGKTSYGSIQLASTTTFGGNITGDDDILLSSRQGIMTFNGSISVPAGKTIRLWNASSDSNQRVIAANGMLTGNLSVEGTFPTKLGKNATCSGNVSVASTATLQLTADANLAETAVVSVETGGMIDIDSGVKVRVAELWIGGVKQPSGRYSTANCSSITGSGVLYVGDKQGLMIIVS